MKNKNIHLILGSGGARGLSHIGVIRYLQEQGMNITRITGCSMGALVGGLYAAGKLDEYQSWVTQINRLDVLRFLDLSLNSSNGFVKGDKIMDKLRDWVGDIDIESLEIPFSAVSSDILSQKEVWINQGDLIDAIRASISVPGIFTPLVKNGMVLVDGGILNPLPIPPKSMQGNEITVAVSLSGRAIKQPFGEERPHIVAESTLNVQQNSTVNRFLQNLQDIFSSEHKEVEKRNPTDMSLSDIMIGMFNAMQDTLARYQLAGSPPDILIEIPANICSSHDFHKAKQLIPAGYYWAEKSIRQQLDFLSD
ncbi:MULTISPECIES: patatin-like phospholipase family protein [Thiomicrorhabdus]|uniref:patatin-like phospholipase family protein n=1 Tax=Thiomicrorhabdus TaxID=2039723 RepID=UPI0029C6A2AA|nr:MULTISPECIES: patatin-like phospholipase family protein [Thiomicrorhabdus]